MATSPVNVTYLTGYQNRLEVETKEFMLSPGGRNAPAFSSLAAATLGCERPALAAPSMFAAGAAHLDASIYPFGHAPLDLGHQQAASDDLLARSLRAARWAVIVRRRLLRPHSATGAPTPVRIGVELAGLPRRDRRRLQECLPQAEDQRLHEPASVSSESVKTDGEGIEAVTRSGAGSRAAPRRGALEGAQARREPRRARHAIRADPCSLQTAPSSTTSRSLRTARESRCTRAPA